MRLKEMNSKLMVMAVVLLGCVAASLVSALEPESYAREPDGPVKLVILSTSDLHDRPQQLPALAHYVNRVRAVQPNVLFLDAGDRVNKGSLAIMYSRGRAMYEIMNACGYDAGVAGNHDFAFGSENLSRLIDMSAHPILGANMTWPDELRPANLKPYVIFELEGLTVAVIGCASTGRNHDPDRNDPARAVRRSRTWDALGPLVETLSDEVDVIVVLTHESNDADLQLARNVPGIDVVIGGHSHSVYNEMQYDEESQTIVHKGGPYGSLGYVVVEWDGGAITGRAAGVVDRGLLRQRDPVVQELVAEWLGALPEREAVGEVAGDMSAGDLARWLAAATLDATGADLVLLDGGAVSEGLSSGELTPRVFLRRVPRLDIVMGLLEDAVALEEILNAVQEHPPEIISYPAESVPDEGPYSVALVLTPYNSPLRLDAAGLENVSFAGLLRVEDKSLWQVAVEAVREQGILKPLDMPAAAIP